MVGSVQRFLVIAAAVLAAAPALAQTGSIRVQVRDATSGDPLPGATVQLSSELGLVPPVAVRTDGQGIAEFPVLRVGAGYVLEIAMPGFGAQRRPGLRVQGGQTLTLDILLTLPTAERIEVQGERAVVDLGEVGRSTRFSDEFVEGLPQRGRFYQDVLTLAPGINDQDGDGNPNVHGARSRDFRAEVSGVSNVDPLTGHWMSYINLDSIEELEVIPAAAGVEFGRAQGGFARVVQKQGTNEFEGVFNFLYRSSKLDGAGSSESGGISTPDFETLQPSLQLSGPLIKDRLWYRLSHEYIHQEDPVDLLNRVVVTTLEQQIHSDQLTWQVSPRNKLAFLYQHDPLEVDNLGIDTSLPPESSRTFERGGSTSSITWTAPASERLLFESTVAYQDTSHDLIQTDPQAVQNCIGFFFLDQLNRSQCRNLTTNLVSGAHYETSLDDRQRLTARSQLTAYRRLFGQSHQIKAGLIVENERYLRELGRRPWFTFETAEDGFTGNFFGTTTMNISVPGKTVNQATGNNWAVYVEDQWKPATGLSVTLGLRFDREEIDAPGQRPLDPEVEAAAFFELAGMPLPPQNFERTVFTGLDDVPAFQQALADAMGVNLGQVNLSSVFVQMGFWQKKRRQDDIHLVNENVSPRLSLAWDPWANGKTKISLSAGRYYDKIFLAVPLVEVEPSQTVNVFVEQECPAGPFSACPFQEGGFRTLYNTVDTNPLTVKMLDRNLSTPYQDEFTLGFEREIARETALRVTLIRRSFEDQLQDVDINHGSGDYGKCGIDVLTVPGGRRINQSILVLSPGTGMITDPFSGETYADTDPGPGDGRLDNCLGETGFYRFFDEVRTYNLPDDTPDPYVLIPGWEELLLLGNFNSATYKAGVIELVRRMYRNWQLEGSYTWSESIGDAEDYDLLLGNEQNLRDDERGFLDYDQRHVVKVNAMSITPWGLRVGGTVRWESGLPYSELTVRELGFANPPAYPFESINSERPRLRYPTGQRNDQRNPSYWTFDLRLSKDIAFGDGRMLQLSAEIYNLLDDDTLTLVNRSEQINSGTRRFGRRFELGLRLAF